MLSSTHSVFRGLQKALEDKLKVPPQNSDPEPVEGLTKAHRKLSEYYIIIIRSTTNHRLFGLPVRIFDMVQ
jgi:hypothetical protein